MTISCTDFSFKQILEIIITGSFSENNDLALFNIQSSISDDLFYKYVCCSTKGAFFSVKDNNFLLKVYYLLYINKLNKIEEYKINNGDSDGNYRYYMCSYDKIKSKIEKYNLTKNELLILKSYSPSVFIIHIRELCENYHLVFIKISNYLLRTNQELYCNFIDNFIENYRYTELYIFLIN